MGGAAAPSSIAEKPGSRFSTPDHAACWLQPMALLAVETLNLSVVFSDL
jgi:hypothetical protein